MFQKDKNICFYVKRYALNLINREILSIFNLKDLWLKGSHLSTEKILNFFFSTLNQLHFDQAPFICLILRTCTSNKTKVLLGGLIDLIDNKIPNIRNEMVWYYKKLDQFLMLSKRQNFWQNFFFIAVVALCLIYYAQNKKLNILQAIIKYAIFVHNILKRAIEIFYQIGLLILY